MPRYAQTFAGAAALFAAIGCAEAGAQTAPSAAAPKWDVRMGVGAMVKPEYPGGKDYELSPVPDLDITWRNRVFLNVQNGLGFYAVKTPKYTLGASVGAHFGRDEGDGDRLRGLGDIDTAAQARLFARYLFGPIDFGAALARDLGASEGFTLDLSAAHTFQLGRRWQLKPGISATLADEDYMQTWFGVTQSQSARSGLAAYKPGGGLASAGLFLNVSYSLTDHWTLGSSVKVERLLGDAADSPVVEREMQPRVMMSASYRF